MTYIKSSYYLIACSQQPISVRQFDTAVGNETLRDHFAEHIDLESVHRRMGSNFAWDPADFMLWADLRLGPKSTLAGVLDRVIPRSYPRLSTAYAERA
jgi:hypothetical protein